MFHNNKSLMDLCGTSREFMVSPNYEHSCYICAFFRNHHGHRMKKWAELSGSLGGESFV